MAPLPQAGRYKHPHIAVNTSRQTARLRERRRQTLGKGNLGSAHSNSSPASATPVAPHTRVGPHAPPSPRGEGFLGAGVDVLRKGITQPHGRGSLDGEGSHSDPWVTAYLTPHAPTQHANTAQGARGQ